MCQGNSSFKKLQQGMSFTLTLKVLARSKRTKTAGVWNTLFVLQLPLKWNNVTTTSYRRQTITSGNEVQFLSQEVVSCLVGKWTKCQVLVVTGLPSPSGRTQLKPDWGQGIIPFASFQAIDPRGHDSNRLCLLQTIVSHHSGKQFGVTKKIKK